MDLRVLRYFLTVAQEENISNAAKQLHITQPTLSRQLMELEEDLQTTLFLRGNGSRGITLTEEGQLLRKRAEEILNLVDKAESEILVSKKTINGTIHIGSGETDVFNLIAKEMTKVQQEYPDVHFSLFSGNADNVCEQLDNGLIDFGIVAEPANIAKYHFIPLPKTDTWGLLMPKNHPLSQKETIHSEDLWGLPLISSAQRLTSNTFSEWLQDNSQKLNIVANYNLIYNASLLVKEGLGCAFCIDHLVDTFPNSDFCFRPLSPKLEMHWYIIWKKYKAFSKASNLFLEQLQAHFDPT